MIFYVCISYPHLSRLILRRDGIKLSKEDETFIVTNVLMYHPEKEKKIAGQGNYIMVSTKHKQLMFPFRRTIEYFDYPFPYLQVSKHKKFQSSRCLYVASSDGSRSDFSYKKCLENFVRINYPGAADSFCRKYFK